MGTKIQSNTSVPQYYTAMDLNAMYPDNHMVKNGFYQHLPSFGKSNSGYLKYNIDALRQTILRQESIFRNQLQELHRLYKRQRDLMNEIRLGGLYQSRPKAENYRFTPLSSHVPHSSTSHSVIGCLPTSSPGQSRLSFVAGNRIPFRPSIQDTRNVNIMEPVMSKTMFMERTFDRETPVSNSGVNIGNVKCGVRGDEFSTHCPPDEQKSSARRKKILFGVEISDGHDDELGAASNMSSQSQIQNAGLVNSESVYASLWMKTCSTFGQKAISFQENEKSLLYGEELDGCVSIGFDSTKSINQEQIELEIPEEKLPWFLRKPQDHPKQTTERKDSYFMNVDSLQDYSHRFFSKAKADDESLLTVNEKSQTSSPMVLGDSVEKVLKDKAALKDLNSYITGLRHHIDLNLSLDEDESPSAPTLPPAVVKIATTEIDLEAQAGIDSCECVEDAAKAIFAISLSGKTCLAEDQPYEPLEASSTDPLKWFAEIISTQHGYNEIEIEDDFEFMTLRLKDMKDEQYHYKPTILDNKDNELTRAALSHKRPRRGQGRRGRHDFQRDILPGLVTLSRHEVTEDLQTFEEVLKAQGCSLESRLSVRNAMKGNRARKRGRVSWLTQTEVSFCREMSPSGWGKRAKRLPRRKCANVYLKWSLQFGKAID